jgi:prevent-host-death family protein
MQNAIPMSELRKRPGDFFNRVIREHPAVVTRHSDAIIALSISQFQELVKHLKLTLNVDYEDNVYAVDIPELDLVAWGADLEEVKVNLAEQAMNYAEEYFERFPLFFHAPNRKAHFPYVIRLSLCEDIDQVMELFCA